MLIEQLDKVIEDYGKDNFLCGNVLVTKQGKEVFHRSCGQANVQLGVPNRADTKFHIASVTKMVISAAVLTYSERGLIGLGDHPGKYVERFKALHPGIQIHHLLSHSSGLHDIYALPDLRFEMSRLNVEKKDFVDYLVGSSQDFEPGERWSYNSTGFIMMGYILESVTGLSFEQVLDQLFFTPLHMNNTGVDLPRIVNEGRAFGHSILDGKLTNADNDRLSEIDAPGELYSTTGDLDKWCDALFNGKLLLPETMNKMFTPYYTTTYGPDLRYGYGWFLGSDYRWIVGGTPGFRSEIRYYPDHDIRIIMLWNYEKVNSHQLFGMMKPILFG